MNHWTASIHWLDEGRTIGELRLHAITAGHPSPGHGDAYTWCCMLARQGETVWFSMAQTAPPLSARQVLREALHRQGIAVGWFERRKTDQPSRWARVV